MSNREGYDAIKKSEMEFQTFQLKMSMMHVRYGTYCVTKLLCQWIYYVPTDAPKEYNMYVANEIRYYQYNKYSAVDGFGRRSSSDTPFCERSSVDVWRKQLFYREI